MGYQCVLVTACMFSGWIEAFPCHKGCPHSGKEIIGVQVFHLDCTFYNLQWWIHPLHWENHTNLNESLENLWESSLCPRHPRSPDKVDRTNEILKLRISKLSETTRLPWPKTLPVPCWLFVQSCYFGKTNSTLDSHRYTSAHWYTTFCWSLVIPCSRDQLLLSL